LTTREEFVKFLSYKPAIMSNKNKGSGIVYSTNPDFFNQTGQEDVGKALPPAQQDLRVWLEKNHRGGKVVSVVKGFSGLESDLKELAKLLKTSLGTGGTVKDNEILIQGDFREKILNFLISKGYKAKKAGG
jgi:translation initiation factor 1